MLPLKLTLLPAKVVNIWIVERVHYSSPCRIQVMLNHDADGVAGVVPSARTMTFGHPLLQAQGRQSKVYTAKPTCSISPPKSAGMRRTSNI